MFCLAFAQIVRGGRPTSLSHRVLFLPSVLSLVGSRGKLDLIPPLRGGRPANEVRRSDLLPFCKRIRGAVTPRRGTPRRGVWSSLAARLAPCSTLSRTLRAGCAGARKRASWTASARGALPIGRSGRRNGRFGRTKEWPIMQWPFANWHSVDRTAFAAATTYT